MSENNADVNPLAKSDISYTEKTRQFYTTFKQHIPAPGTKASLSEDVIPEDRLHLKMTLIAEEFTELVEAVYGKKAAGIIESAFVKAVKVDDFNRDIVAAADATGDLRFVLDGFDIEAAIPTEEVFEEVFKSNMTKLDENGNPILADGTGSAPLNKIIKSKLYVDPDVARILEDKRAR